MGRKSVEVNPECGKRLKLWLDHVGLTAKTLCSAINYTPQYISDVINGKKRLTPELAEIIANLPDSYIDSNTGEKVNLGISIIDKVSKEYLLLESEDMTMGHSIHSQNNNQSDREEIITKLLELHGYVIRDVTENMPVLHDEDGREYRETMYAIASPWSKSALYLRPNALNDFMQKIDDNIEMQCMFCFKKILEHDIKNRGVNNG